MTPPKNFSMRTDNPVDTISFGTGPVLPEKEAVPAQPAGAGAAAPQPEPETAVKIDSARGSPSAFSEAGERRKAGATAAKSKKTADVKPQEQEMNRSRKISDADRKSHGFFVYLTEAEMRGFKTTVDHLNRDSLRSAQFSTFARRAILEFTEKYSPKTRNTKGDS
jgi:hypothetical protein